MELEGQKRKLQHGLIKFKYYVCIILKSRSSGNGNQQQQRIGHVIIFYNMETNFNLRRNISESNIHYVYSYFTIKSVFALKIRNTI